MTCQNLFKLCGGFCWTNAVDEMFVTGQFREDTISDDEQLIIDFTSEALDRGCPHAVYFVDEYCRKVQELR